MQSEELVDFFFVTFIRLNLYLQVNLYAVPSLHSVWPVEFYHRIYVSLVSRSDACCLVVKVMTLNAQCLMPTLHQHAGCFICVCVCVCVFFY